MSKSVLETLKAARKQDFSITDGKGFQMTFANGYTVSIQFGVYSYCEASTRKQEEGRWDSASAEIAAWGPDGVWFIEDDWGDSVKGWVSTDEAAAFIEKVRTFPAFDAAIKKANQDRSDV